MSKHIADHPRRDAERLPHYARIERDETGKPADQTEKLLRKPREEKREESLKRFTEIERRG